MLMLKKIFYTLFAFIIVLLIAIVVVANSSFGIKKAADMFAPDYNITYDDIRGNILAGVKISGLKFDDKILADNLLLSWNPSKLLYSRIAINKLGIEALDTDVLKALIASFSSDDNSSSEPFSFVVIVNNASLSVNPFEEQGIAVSKTLLKIKDVMYADNELDIGHYALLFESSVGKIDLTGKLDRDTVTLDHVLLEGIDTLGLQALFSEDNNESNSTKNETITSVEQNSSAPKKMNHLVPKYVVINDLHADVVPVTYDPIHILNVTLDIKDFKLNVEKLLVENASIDLQGKTNLTNFIHGGKIKDNELIGEIRLTPNNTLFELYKLPLRKEAIGDIVVDLDATDEQVSLDIKSSAKNILITQKSDTNSSEDNTSKEFNVDIDSLVSHVVYMLKDNKLTIDSKVMISTPYAKDISVTNSFVMDKNISYSGDVNVKKLIGIDAKFTKPLNNLTIEYTGDLESVTTDILSDGLKGSFHSLDFKKAALHIETTKSIVLRDMLELPAELNSTKADVIVDLPLDLTSITPLKGKVKILSNVSNVDADLIYDKTLKAKITSNMPEDSLLKAFDENVKWNALNPLVAEVDLGEKNVGLKLQAKVLSSDLTYSLENGNVDGTVQLAGLKSTIDGNVEKKITIKSNVSSVKSLFDNVQAIYTLESLPPVEGALKLSVEIDELKEVNVLLSSPEIIYHSARETNHIINDIKLAVSADKSKVVLKSYALTYDKMNIFSTKPSIVNMNEDTIEISELWLNDQLKVTGLYNTKTQKGNISADAAALHIAHKMIDLDMALNIDTLLNAGQTSIKGNITLLGGDIHHDIATKTYPSSSDILIVQDMKKQEASPFMDKLSVQVEVKTKKPLVYKQGSIDIQAIVDLSVHKAEYSELMVLGEVQIVKGGSYIFEGKKFVLDKSNIYFTGNPNKPLLDISVKHKSLRHMITIGISGTPATPIITFSSVPSLQKEQILSIILFDSEEGSGTNSGEDMMKMMGGAMAKSALTDLGIKLDHLAIGANGSVEVGKKITDKITFVYVNGEIPQVRVRYQHSPHVESVISADEISQAYDIVYRRDFSEEDIILLGK